MESRTQNAVRWMGNLDEIIFNPLLVFFPYFVLYLAFCALNVSVDVATKTFEALHILVFFAVVFFSCKKFRGRSSWFWIALFLFFLIPGAYLEYPSDPWEHFRRIFSWQGVDRIGQSVIKEKFAYFFGWSLLSRVPLLRRLFSVDLYSAFWQLLFSYQFFRFFRHFGTPKRKACVLVLGVIAFFGTNVFGIRYYALSSTPLAYIIYLSGLMIVADILDGQYLKLLLLPFVWIFISMNHFQEKLYFAMNGAILVGFTYGRRYLHISRRGYLALGLLVLFASWVFGYWIQHEFPYLFGSVEIQGGISRFGTFKFWKLHHPSPYFETLGVYGVLGLISAVVFSGRYPLFSMMSLCPFLMLCFPPAVLVICSFIRSAYDSYRILYAFPLSILFTLGLYEVVDWSLARFLRNSDKIRADFWVAGILCCLAAVPYFPWRGRLFFQVYQNSLERGAEQFEPLLRWAYLNKGKLDGCSIVTDDFTQFVLTANLGWLLRADRTAPLLYTQKNKNELALDHLIKADPTCGILVTIATLPQASPSLMADLSNHWDARLGDLGWYYSDGFRGATKKLIAKGWVRTFVPPFYEYYQNPEPFRYYSKKKSSG